MSSTLAGLAEVELSILTLRGQRVLLASDLAQLYGVETKVLMQAVKRNIERFPLDFMFQLNKEEWQNLRSQIVTSNRGGTRYAPYVFTEQGVGMLSSVLKSQQAVQVNIEIMRAFVRLRSILAGNRGLAHRLDELEQRYDKQLSAVFDAIRQLMAPPSPTKRPVGFTADIERKKSK